MSEKRFFSQHSSKCSILGFARHLNNNPNDIFAVQVVDNEDYFRGFDI